MGSRNNKGIVIIEESEQIERRRRSSRIIALEEKREKEKELERNNDSANTENRNKGKIKETIDDFIYDYDEQYSPTNKKGRKYKALHQLILSTQPMLEGQQHLKSGIISTINVSALNGMPQKQVLEHVLDVLQRKDLEGLFAEPTNHDVEDYYKIVKQPMDFGTMRAKLHENMYTSMAQFKLDIYLLCANAMNANPPNTKRHQVAVVIHSLARRVFEDLSAAADPQYFQLKPPAAPSRKQQPRTLGHARFRRKPSGKNIDTRFSALEIEKRDKYRPPNDKPLCAEVLNAPKSNFQLNKEVGNYNDSLMRYMVELGPAAQNVAAKTLEDLNFRQFLNGETWTPSLANVVHTQITQPTVQTDEARKLEALKFQQLSSTGETPKLNLLHKVSGSQPISHAGVNIRENVSKGKRVGTEEDWDAYAAILLSNIYSNNDKREINKGLTEDQNVSSSLQGQGANQNRVLQLGGRRENNNNNNPAMIVNKNVVGSSSTSKGGASFSHVHVRPTRVISEPQPKPQEHSMLSFVDPKAPTLSHMNLVAPSQAYNFSRWDNCSGGLGTGNTSYLPGNFQNLLSPAINNFNNRSSSTHNQALNQFAPPTNFGYHDLQVKLGQLNPMGPFPMLQPKSSSALQPVPQEQGQEGTSLLLKDNDQELNLSLQL